MSRIKADLLMLLVALIWGMAFVAQKDALSNIGPYTFVAARFLISALLVLPFALREYRQPSLRKKLASGRGEILSVCAAFCAGVILQQVGIKGTTVTNAGFLTGLYVVFVPVICTFFYRQKLSGWIFLAAFLSVAGIWLLSGGRLDGLSFGDALVFACSIGFAVQVTLIGKIMGRVKAPLFLSFLQYAAVTVVSVAGALLFEHPSMEAIGAAVLPILYAGVISGGIGYTLQTVAQQYTPASDSAIILSGESVFAAIGGAWLIGERLTPMQYGGCALIAAAIVITELMPLFFRKKKSRA